MAGLFGIVRRKPGTTLAPAFGRMFDRRPDRDRFHQETLIDPNGRWALGRSHLGVLTPDAQLCPGAPVQALFHGDLHNEDELRTELTREGVPATKGLNDIIIGLSRHDRATMARRLTGAFCAALLDTTAGEITLIADPVGSYPLYWATGPYGFVFASELRALLRSDEIPREIDPRAVADYLVFGFPFGTKTLAAGVELVPPGASLTYRWETGDVSIRQDSDLASAFVPWTESKEAYFEALTERFGDAVDRTLAGAHSFGLSLSGGLDSRAILSTLNGSAPSLTTCTLGVDGCADQAIAARLAALSGTRHLFFELDDRYLADFLPNLARMVSLTDGMYLSHGLTEILALDFIDTTGIDVLLRGHGGELAKASLAWPFHTDARVHAMKTAGEFVPYLLSRANYISPQIEFQTLFTPEWAREVAGIPRRSLEQSIGQSSLPPADLCSYIYLMEHHRRSTVASLELFRDRVEVRLPFIDADFLRLLFRAPSRWRDGLDIHKTLTAKHHAALLRVRNSNTGAPGGAGPLAEAAFDKINTILKRLNVRGYRHYHNFDAWMKARLLESVESVLLDRDTIGRGIFREGTLRQLMHETRGGGADHGYLLQVMLIIELWQRENL